MTEKTFKMIEYLNDWQNIAYEEVESAIDVKVFNIIGTIVQLVKNGYMEMSETYHFVSDSLSVEQEAKEKVTQIIANAYDQSTVLH